MAFCSQCSSPLPAGSPPPPGQPASGDQYPAAGQQPPVPPPPPAQPASGDQYPAAGQYPSGEQPPGFPPPGQYPSGEQPPGFPPPGQYPTAEQHPPPGAYGQGAPPPGYGGPPYPPGYGAPPPGGGSSGGRVLVVVVALVAVAAIVASLIIVGGGDGDSDEVVLEPIGSVQQDDFAGNLDVENLGGSVDMTPGGEPDMDDEAAVTLAGREADGDAPGLYGGSRDTAVCDVQRLVDFLTDTANADRAEAWAGVLGIGTGEIADYVGGLTAVRLRFDTRVTNHGFRDGRATPFQSLVQAGTAVLVDAEGVPRVKCNCGNPLLEPEPVGDGESGSIDELAQNPEDDWDIDAGRVVSIRPSGGSVESFAVVNIDDGDVFARPAGSNGETDGDPSDVTEICEQLAESPSCGGTGDEELTLGSGTVQVTLQWGSNADLDLHVTEPAGNEISWRNSGPSATGGQLDVDSNVGCDLDGAVENVFWPVDSPAPPGDYTVEVTGFDVETTSSRGETCGGGDYTLTVAVEGQDPQIESGSVGDGETDSYTFTVG